MDGTAFPILANQADLPRRYLLSGLTRQASDECTAVLEADSSIASHAGSGTSNTVRSGCRCYSWCNRATDLRGQAEFADTGLHNPLYAQRGDGKVGRREHRASILDLRFQALKSLHRLTLLAGSVRDHGKSGASRIRPSCDIIPFGLDTVRPWLSASVGVYGCRASSCRTTCELVTTSFSRNPTFRSCGGRLHPSCQARISRRASRWVLEFPSFLPARTRTSDLSDVNHYSVIKWTDRRICERSWTTSIRATVPGQLTRGSHSDLEARRAS
jgi:hypothetical protein